jgi:predicted small integral membrane protein
VRGMLLAPRVGGAVGALGALFQGQPLDDGAGPGRTDGLEWMAWTPGTFVFVVVVLASLVALTVLAVLRPSTERRGFLPMPTARGDRIYVGLLGIGLILVGLIALTDLPLGVGLGVAAVWMAVVVRWG